MKPSSSSAEPRRFKIPKRFTPFVFAFYMAAIMGLLMCSTIVAVSTGFSAGYPARVFKAYSLAMPIAFCCELLLRPLVTKLVAATVEH